MHIYADDSQTYVVTSPRENSLLNKSQTNNRLDFSLQVNSAVHSGVGWFLQCGRCGRIWLAATSINLSGSGSWTFPAPDWTNNKHAARWAFIAFYFQTIKKWQLFRKRATAQMFYYKPNMIKRWILFTFRTAAVYLSCFHPHSSLMGFHLSASQAELWRPTLRETADSRSLTGRCGESDWAADVLWPLASSLGAADDTPPSISAGSMSVCVCVCATPSPCDHTTHCLFIRCR